MANEIIRISNEREFKILVAGIKAVVEKIALLSNIILLSDNRSKVRKAYDRIITQIRKVRL